MEAYLDNSATTRCSELVRDVVVRTMMEDYGNPSSKHRKGLDAEHYLRDARETIARTMKVNEKEIFFTSGGTESDNWALIGAAMANRRTGMHLITTAVEHAAVLMPMQYLKEQGFSVTYLPVDGRGRISLSDLEAAIREDTILVSMMYVNNEVGTVEPVEEAARLIKKKNPRTLFHVDAIQAYGKFAIYPKRAGIDMLSVSGHKIHGPKGIGFLYINEKVKIHPLILGGGQQKGMRSGTDNVPGAAGLAAAAKDAYEHLEQNVEYLKKLRGRMLDGLRALNEQLEDGQQSQEEKAGNVRLKNRAEEGERAGERQPEKKAGETVLSDGKLQTKERAGRSGQQGMQAVVINSGEDEYSAPHIVSAAFPGIRSEVLLHALEDRGICVSAGSACSSNKKLPVSTVLKELHLRPELQESTLRFSFSCLTTEEEIDYCLETLGELLPVLRRYIRR